jgi:hypothetical protein
MNKDEDQYCTLEQFANCCNRRVSKVQVIVLEKFYGIRRKYTVKGRAIGSFGMSIAKKSSQYHSLLNDSIFP